MIWQRLNNRGLETKDPGNEIEMSHDSESENKHCSGHELIPTLYWKWVEI